MTATDAADVIIRQRHLQSSSSNISSTDLVLSIFALCFLLILLYACERYRSARYERRQQQQQRYLEQRRRDRELQRRAARSRMNQLQREQRSHTEQQRRRRRENRQSARATQLEVEMALAEFRRNKYLTYFRENDVQWTVNEMNFQENEEGESINMKNDLEVEVSRRQSVKFKQELEF